MNNKEKRDRKLAMDEANIPIHLRSSFIRYANKFGMFNLHDDFRWYQYSPLEQRSKRSETTLSIYYEYLNQY